MLIVTTETIVGKEILEVKGLVRGSTVRSLHENERFIHLVNRLGE